MGVWKKITGPFRRSKKVRIITSGVVGAAVGFFVGGGVQGAVAGAIYGTSLSIENGGALVIGMTVPLGRPKDRSRDSTYEQTDIFSVPEEEEPLLYVQTPVEEIPVQTPVEEISVQESRLKEWMDNAKNKRTVFYRVLEVVGIVLQAGVDYQIGMDEYEDTCRGPRFVVTETDSVELALLKTRANNLMDDIETNCGNYSKTHTPLTDIFTGRELLITLESIKEIQGTSKQGALNQNGLKQGALIENTCPTCHGFRTVEKVVTTTCSSHVPTGCTECNGFGVVENLSSTVCSSCGGMGTITY